MEKTLKESLINYFVQLTRTVIKWTEFTKSVERPLHALKNQSEQFRHVINDEIKEAEICTIEGVRDKLIFKINVGIETEISQILNELRRVRNYVEDLKTKLERLEMVRSDASVREPSFKELVDGTPLRPRLDLLLEWAIESSRYYSKLCRTIFENFKTLDYKSEASVNGWIKSFEQNRHERSHIERILGFTQFLVKETSK